jgi:hypothetical protein
MAADSGPAAEANSGWGFFGGFFAGAGAALAVEWLASTSFMARWFGTGAATAAGQKLNDSVCKIERLPVPGTPNGMPLGEFGQLMNWGRGSDAARAQISELSRSGLAQSGLTPDLARAWANFYANEALRNPSNPSAAGRADLMEAAAQILEGP